MARQGPARHGQVRPGGARHGKARHGFEINIRRGEARCGSAGRGAARQGFSKRHKAWHGSAWHGSLGQCLVGQGRDFQMKRTGHTSAHRGKAVVVYMRDGRQIHGVYSEGRGRFIVLTDGRKILKSEMRCVTINKQP